MAIYGMEWTNTTSVNSDQSIHSMCVCSVAKHFNNVNTEIEEYLGKYGAVKNLWYGWYGLIFKASSRLSRYSGSVVHSPPLVTADLVWTSKAPSFKSPRHSKLKATEFTEQGHCSKYATNDKHRQCYTLLQTRYHTYLARELLHFFETFDEWQVVSHRVLPAWLSGAVVGKLPLYPLVDLLHRKCLGRRALKRHEYHTRERQWRLSSVFAIVPTISNAQDHVKHMVKHLLGIVTSALSQAVVSWFVAQTLFALWFPRASASKSTNPMGRSSERIAHGIKHPGIL